MEVVPRNSGKLNTHCFGPRSPETWPSVWLPGQLETIQAPVGIPFHLPTLPFSPFSSPHTLPPIGLCIHSGCIHSLHCLAIRRQTHFIGSFNSSLVIANSHN
ncbi:unnamed protein product [Protopolystoma xenopodis]|uniref:Uncharacterized protein n=1 Tax=Protopolystoma xenopodis TaxID=117903 RepID=A0A448X9N7_9PLAT|nr:unnamed protein product [Protopolystoma xenopodis]